MSIIPFKTSIKKDENRFHIVVAPVLASAQVFGLLPITGIFSYSIKDIKFKLLSKRTFHTSFWFISAFVLLYIDLNRLSNEESFSVKTFGAYYRNQKLCLFENFLFFSASSAFYFLGIISSFLYLRIAYKWNELLNLFEEVENIFCNGTYTLSGWSLKKQVWFATCTVMTFATIEHVLFSYSFINERFVEAETCNLEVGSWIYFIVNIQFYYIFKTLSMNPISILWAEYMNISFTFAWSFIDLFIMIMSMSIATKFRMINERLQCFKGRILSDAFWDEIRRHYNKVCQLNDYIGKLIGSLICVACLGDLYSICTQLLNVTKPLPYRASKIYFWYSTIFLISRTFTMFLITASVNDESIKPLIIFRTIPKYGWLQQLQRLSNQIQQNGAALSGRNFFSLTRGMIVSIAGTIVTYELVLLQLNNPNILPEKFDPCNGISNNSANRN